MFPTFLIHRLNECLSLRVSDTENYTYNMDEEYTLSKDFEGISMSVNAIYFKSSIKMSHLLQKTLAKSQLVLFFKKLITARVVHDEFILQRK